LKNIIILNAVGLCCARDYNNFSEEFYALNICFFSTIISSKYAQQAYSTGQMSRIRSTSLINRSNF